MAPEQGVGRAEGRGELIPNQDVLINAIVLQEAKLSSEVENGLAITRYARPDMCSRDEYILRTCQKLPGF
jgi:hypothetical protein